MLQAALDPYVQFGGATNNGGGGKREFLFVRRKGKTYKFIYARDSFISKDAY